jgi:hypothetical protein
MPEFPSCLLDHLHLMTLYPPCQLALYHSLLFFPSISIISQNVQTATHPLYLPLSIERSTMADSPMVDPSANRIAVGTRTMERGISVGVQTDPVHIVTPLRSDVSDMLKQKLSSDYILSAGNFAARYFSTQYEPSDAVEYDRVHPAPAAAMGNVPYGFPHQPAAKTYYLVSFKCGRSEIFYIPVHMGLNVRAGEMVIVEGDRGQDLGSVVHCDVSEEQAKKLKREADHEHFKWLMMYSRYNSAARGGLSGISVNPMAHEHRTPEREPDFKPKMIKRLAHQHEINGLKEKEGLEARAKRTCASKVSDHGLQMEILDAEYQLSVSPFATTAIP